MTLILYHIGPYLAVIASKLPIQLRSHPQLTTALALEGPTWDGYFR